MKNKNVFLVGGGTGGHAAPVFAVYNCLKKTLPESRLTVIGAGTSEEMKFFSELNYQKISAGKFHRYATLKNIKELFNFLIGLVQAKLLLLLNRPSIIFSKGGYASLPICLIARFLHIPYFLHESDIIMGKVNFSLARNAKKVFVTYPVKYYPKINNAVESGPILREAFKNETQKIDLSLFGFKQDKPTLLITGGSQGALNITNYFIKSGHSLLEKYNIIHQAGKHSINEAQLFYGGLSEEEKSSYYLTEFLTIGKKTDQMYQALKLANLVISRASSTITEAAKLGKPMILVPWKYSAQNHQMENANFFQKNNAAVVVQDDEIEQKPLLKEIDFLFADQKNMEEMGERAKRLFLDGGTELICSELLKELKED